METAKKPTKKTIFYSGLGRRKRSVARVWLYEKKGEFTVNSKKIEEIYPSIEDDITWVKPFHTVGVSHPKSKFSATILVKGGGIRGQLQAIQLGITRALIKLDPANKESLKKAALTTRDPREVERKKTSQPKARKKVQYSKR